jgi:TatD DNase family protein
MIRLIDSHCHVDRHEYGPDIADVLVRAKAAGLSHAVVVGLWRSAGDFGGAIELASVNPGFLSPTIGIHPHDVAEAPAEDFARCEAIAADPRVVGIGETGLDYHYDHSPRPTQREKFRWHIALAKRLKKPLVVHVREAHPDCAAILDEEKGGPGVIHCFTGNWDEAQKYLELGFHISISGVVTFKNSEALRDAVPKVPEDRLLIETDAPFLAPVPHRGKRNEPAFVAEVARKVAELRGVSVDVIAESTASNAVQLFGLRMGAQ